MKPLQVGKMAGAAHMICNTSPIECLELISCAKFWSQGCSLSALLRSRPQALRRTHVRAPAAAEDSIQDRYCIQGDQWGNNCEFSTYEQCKATASGTGGTCNENPRYLFEEQRRGYWPPR